MTAAESEASNRRIHAVRDDRTIDLENIASIDERLIGADCAERRELEAARRGFVRRLESSPTGGMGLADDASPLLYEEPSHV